MREALAALGLLGEAVVALASARRRLRRDPAVVRPLLVDEPRTLGEAERATAAAIARAIERAARLRRGTTCLQRAMAAHRMLAHRMLARRGLRPALRLGSQGASGARFTAHAWLELGGVPIYGAPSPLVFVPPREAARSFQRL